MLYSGCANIYNEKTNKIADLWFLWYDIAMSLKDRKYPTTWFIAKVFLVIQLEHWDPLPMYDPCSPDSKCAHCRKVWWYS